MKNNIKQQIRLGVFETNSSSEHSIAIINSDDYKQWKEGKLVARSAGRKEGTAQGNFWTYLHELEFIPSEQKDEKNIEYLTKHYNHFLNPNDGWKTYKNPDYLIERYKSGSKFFDMCLYCTFDEYYESGFDGEDALHFSNELPDGKMLIGDYYHT